MSFARRHARVLLVLGALGLVTAAGGAYLLLRPDADHEKILASLPPLRVTSIQARMKEFYDQRLGLFWIVRPVKLARLVDVKATRRFLRVQLARPELAQVNILCTLYQLGDPLADARKLMTESYWRDDQEVDPFNFIAYYLITKEEPGAHRMHLAREESLAAILYLLDRGGSLSLSLRFAIALRLGMMRLFETPFPPSVKARLEESLGRGEGSAPRRLADLTWRRYLGSSTSADRAWLSAFIDARWDGRSFPETGCGNKYCATKYLLRVVSLAFMYDVDLGRERAAQMAAYLVALQNRDGSFRQDLRSTRMEGVVENMTEGRCMEFCQLHIWRYINSLNYLIDRYDPDPAQVKRLAAKLRSARR